MQAASSLCLWKAVLCLHASKRWVLSLISVSLLNLALLCVSNLSLLHSFHVVVPNVCAVDSGPLPQNGVVDGVLDGVPDDFSI